MDLKLKDKVVLITGATGGIGKAIVKAFLDEGSKLILTGRDQEKLDELIEEIGNPGEDRVRTYLADLTKEDEVKSMIDQGVSDFGSLYSVIANAGHNGKSELVQDATKENWDSVMDINVYGVLYTLKHSVPYLLENGEGSVVALGSEASYVGSPQMSAYIASKHAVAGLIKSLAVEVGPKGIHANYVAPSAVNTDMMRRIEKNTFGDSKTEEEAMKEFSQGVLNERYAEPEEIANAILYLASEVSQHVMGWGIRLDGGKHIQ